MIDQSQKVGEGAVALQSGRDIVVHKGISAEEFRQVLAATREVASDVARMVVETRVNAFEDRVAEKFIRHGSGNVEAFQEPDFLFAFREAQKASATTDDTQVIDSLVDLIAERSKQIARSRLTLSLNDAVKVTSNLTKNEFAALSLIFLLRYTKRLNVGNLKAFTDYFNSALAPLLPDISTEYSAYQYLESQRCATISMGSASLQDIFRGNYGGVFCDGFTIEELEAALPEGKKKILSGRDLIIPCLNDKTKFQLNALNKEHALTILGEKDLAPEQCDALANLFESKLMSLSSIEALVIPFAPEFKTLMNLWGKTLENINLTAVGIAIGYINAKRIHPLNADLSIWIK